ncbi:MAG: hypothetical protein AB8E15_00470 [Bdellovibrionales bacterium]
MERQTSLRPQDVVIAAKIHIDNGVESQKSLADQLCLSQAEIVKSLKRLRDSRLLNGDNQVARIRLKNFIKHGLSVCFPSQVGRLQLGIEIGGSFKGFKKNLKLDPNEDFVYQDENGDRKGMSILPLYPNLKEALKEDIQLHKLVSVLELYRLGEVSETSQLDKLLSEFI